MSLYREFGINTREALYTTKYNLFEKCFKNRHGIRIFVQINRSSCSKTSFFFQNEQDPDVITAFGYPDGITAFWYPDAIINILVCILVNLKDSLIVSVCGLMG